MRLLLTFTAVFALLVAPLTAQSSDGQAQPDSEDTVTAAGSALSTIFSPARAPKRKTMGLLQRSFLDLADQGDQELEVAIVIDGTDSMATDLAGVRNSVNRMLSDLRKYRNNEVRAAIVVYRDAGSPSGDVVIPLKQFTADEAEIEKAVQALQPESGAPYFHELPDLGLYKALDELPWTDDDQVTKWILLFGDAPPYAESYEDAKTPEAFRRYSTSVLVSLAKQKKIRINCVLCTSSENVVGPYNDAIDETRTFMSMLSSGTDGLMLDLSYDAIRTAMMDAGKQPDVQLAEIRPIGAIDLAAVRRNDVQRTEKVQNVSLAVVPHMSFASMSWDARHPAVQVSTALRTKFGKLPGVRVASPRRIKEQLWRLRAEGIRDEKAIRGLAARLNVDFVVWGQIAADSATVQTAAYRRDNGKQIFEITKTKFSDDIAYELISASAERSPGDKALAQLFSSVQSLQGAIQEPWAGTEATTSEVLAALESLEQALEYEAGSEDSVKLLDVADQASKNAITAEPTNALAHWLQSNVAYNQAARLRAIGQTEAAAARMRDSKASLNEAAKYRRSIKTPSLVTEIEADYYLLVVRDTAKAVERYIQMTDPSQPVDSQVRGHWMLSGIYAGDWGQAEEPIVDPEEARRHIVEIMANWPDSPEAKLLKEWLRWDDSKEQTEFNFLPRLNMELSNA